MASLHSSCHTTIKLRHTRTNTAFIEGKVMNRCTTAKKIRVAILLAGFSGSLSAAGFAIIEHSVTGLGNAFAGATAGAEDSSTIFFNPAGLSKISGTEVVQGLHMILPNADFTSDSSTDVLGNPLTGDDGGDGGVDALVPNFYFSTDITDDLRFGLGINAPFGLATDYGDNWQGRYHAINSDLLTVNLNPTFAYAVNEQFSIGVGVNVQYAHMRLTQAVDFGTICFARVDPQTCTAQGVTPQAADGFSKVKADDWSVGYNVGLLYEPIPGTRFGLAYRSKISHTLRGTAEFRVPDNARFLTAGGAFKNTNARGDVDMPENISFGAFHEINEQWAVMGNVIWTRWNRFQQLSINFDNPAQPNSTVPQKWENSFHYALGATYKANKDWTFRAGTAYDETPVPSAEFRSTRIPSTSRYWLSGGISYHGLEEYTIDFSYAHLFVFDSKIDNTDNLGHRLNGEYENSVDIISAQVRWAF